MHDDNCVKKRSASNVPDRGSDVTASNPSLSDDLRTASLPKDQSQAVLEAIYSAKFTESINTLVYLGYHGQMSKKNKPKWQDLCSKYMDVGSELYKDGRVNLSDDTKRQVDELFKLIISEIKSNPKATAIPSQQHYQILFDEFMEKLKEDEHGYERIREEYRKWQTGMDTMIPYFKRSGSCKSEHTIPLCEDCGWHSSWHKNFKKRGIHISTPKHWTEKNVWYIGVKPDNRMIPQPKN